MNRKLRLAALLLLAGTLSAHGQDDDSSAFQAPTQLAALAAAPGARVRVLGEGNRIDTATSAAEFSAVEITTADGARQRGVEVSLEGEGRGGWTLLDVAQAQQLRNELARFDGQYAFASSCGGICIHGIARCRPSQAVAQALCPAVYSTADGEEGVHLSTPLSSFRFPDVRGNAFAAALEAAIASAGTVAAVQR